MKQDDAQKKISSLVSELQKHADLYYNKDAPEISDEAYDSLYQELVSLEQAFPHLQLPQSPTMQVAAKARILDGFEKSTHQFRQWSFDNIFDWEGLINWHKKITRLIEKKSLTPSEPLEYIVELKIDGLKVILDYEKGVFRRGSTRGDGTVGEDITENLSMVRDVPATISEKKSVSIFGEAFIEKKQLEEINKGRIEEGLDAYANPRNLAAGTLRQLNTKIVKDRNLKVFVYDFNSNDVSFNTHDEELKFLSSQKFNVNKQYLKTTDIGKIQKFYHDWVTQRHNQGFGVDGLVIKLNDMNICRELGYTAKAPRFAVAYKFPAEQQTTNVCDITLQIGRTGILTPVAELKPVQIDGSLVKRATLHNMDEIQRLGLMIGDTVIIEKAGDIIPKIKSVIIGARIGNEKSFSLPKYLAKKNILARKEVSIAGVSSWYVEGQNEEMSIRHLAYSASKKVFNIEGMGEKNIRALYGAGIIKQVSDIFSLDYEHISSLPLFKEKATKNLLDAIEQARETTLSIVISSFGIRHVGEEVAQIYADNFTDIDNLINAKYEDYINLHGIGSQIAESTTHFFSDKKNLEEIEKLKNILTIKKSQKNNQDLQNYSFVITGTLSDFTRESIKKFIKDSGGKVSSQVSAQSSYLVAGEKAGSKLKKAQTLGIIVLNEKEFIEKFVSKK
jgi:DNA ligase (NAD+)